MTWRYLGSLLLLFVPSSLGEFFVETVREPVVAVMGGDVILDCQLTPAVMPVEMEVRWFRQDWSKVVHLYRDGRDHPEAQEGRYSGRTQLFPDQLAVGNVSLLLRGVNIGDQGGYKCFVVSRNQDKEDSLQLNVKNLGDQPLLRAVSYEGSAVKLGCRSQGWFPRPGVEWRDGEGGQVEGHEVEVEVEPTGLMTLESTVTVTADQRGPFTCSISNTLGDSRHAQLDISDVFFPRTSGWLVGFCIILFVLLAGLVAAWFLIRKARKQDKMMKELRMRPTIHDYESLRHNLAKQEDEAKQEKQKYLEDLEKQKASAKAEYNDLLQSIEWGKMLRFAVTVRLDPETANGNLEVSEDLTSVCDAGGWCNVTENAKRFERFPFVLARDPFAEGKHYWEVTVDGCHNWDLGVALASAKRTGKITLCPAEGYWAIGHRWDIYQAKDTEIVDLGLPDKVGRVGIFLNFDDGVVSFHDAGRRRQIHAAPIAFHEPVYPFFCPWRSREPIRITPVTVTE